jgi:hypothetical protein
MDKDAVTVNTIYNRKVTIENHRSDVRFVITKPDGSTVDGIVTTENAKKLAHKLNHEVNKGESQC